MNRFLLFLSLLAFLGCGAPDSSESETPEIIEESAEEEVPEIAEQAEAVVQAPEVNKKDLPGNYVGAFDADVYDEKKNYSLTNRINMVIEKLENGKVSGHSVVAGNSRPFSGTYSRVEGLFQASAAEPGDDRYDGKFEFTLDPVSEKVKGIWKANDQNLAVSQRKYVLSKMEFAYDPELELPETIVYAEVFTKRQDLWDAEGEVVTKDVLNVNPSKVKLKKEQVENMYKADLEVLRNSIYARHGYSFKNRRMRYLFDNQVEWYIPVSTDVRDELTALEKDNIDLLKRYEDHAEEYYDYFGR